LESGKTRQSCDFRPGFRSVSFCSEEFKSKGAEHAKNLRGITINTLFAFSAPLLTVKDASRKLRDAFGKTKIQALTSGKGLELFASINREAAY
jgi:hypothetical protein